MILTIALTLTLAGDPPPKSETMKALMKDAVKSDGPDVSNMPFTVDSIRQIVLSYQPKIQGCYEEHIANKK